MQTVNQNRGVYRASPIEPRAWRLSAQTMNASIANPRRVLAVRPVEAFAEKDLAGAADRLRAVAPGCPVLAYSIHQYRRVADPYRPWSFVAASEDGHDGIALATLGKGRISASLGVSVWPSEEGSPRLLTEVCDFADRWRASELWVERFGPAPLAPPDGVEEENVLEARSYVLELPSYDRRALSKNHSRNVRKAEKNGVRVVSGTTGEMVRAHIAMWQTSMRRREGRGERIGEEMGAGRLERYFDAQAGLLFQAILAGEVVSSALMVRIGDCVFYDSGGSSKQGMDHGASPFVLSTAIEHYRDAGCGYFNLGVSTPDRPGLESFKQGFGAKPHDFRITTFCRKSVVRRSLHSLRRLVRA